MAGEDPSGARPSFKKRDEVLMNKNSFEYCSTGVDGPTWRGEISGMTITVDPVISARHLTWIEETLRKKGIPGKVEIFERFLEISPPIWGDPVALEILRPVVENVLLDIAKELRKKAK